MTKAEKYQFLVINKKDERTDLIENEEELKRQLRIGALTGWFIYEIFPISRKDIFGKYEK